MPERRDAYLDFIGISQDNPRRQRHGLYSSHVFGRPPRQVKIIIDTFNDCPSSQ